MPTSEARGGWVTLIASRTREAAAAWAGDRADLRTRNVEAGEKVVEQLCAAWTSAPPGSRVCWFPSPPTSGRYIGARRSTLGKASS